MDAPDSIRLHESRANLSHATCLRTTVDAPASAVAWLLARSPVRARLDALRSAAGPSVDQIIIQTAPPGDSQDRCELSLPLARAAAAPAIDSALRMLARLKWDATHIAGLLPLLEQAPSPRVIVSGASGAIAREVIASLQALGVRIDRLVRRGSPPRTPNLAGRDWWWEPREQGQVEPGALDGALALIHSAAQSVMGRWTPARKLAIRESRVQGTRVLAVAAAHARVPPRVFISASGAHAYGDRGEDTMTEEAGYGSDFLAELVRDWEAATQPALDAGIRTVVMRIGVVQHASSGAVREMSLPFRLGLGVILGAGSQHWPWVSMPDVVGATLHAIATPVLRGPINVVGPQEVTAEIFARTLARVLDRPLFARVPASLLRALMGQQVDGLIMSTRVAPDALRRSGYHFALPALESALRWELGGLRPSDVGVARA